MCSASVACIADSFPDISCAATMRVCQSFGSDWMRSRRSASGSRSCSCSSATAAAIALKAAGAFSSSERAWYMCCITTVRAYVSPGSTSFSTPACVSLANFSVDSTATSRCCSSCCSSTNLRLAASPESWSFTERHMIRTPPSRTIPASAATSFSRYTTRESPREYAATASALSSNTASSSEPSSRSDASATLGALLAAALPG
mmetsp:Transcript_29728/g.95572  ORF Transcript_29728/g.95572 Transcript_29728/m.95572 type:complete len:203 (-) Transcript_29728:526-1134(-)